MQPHTYTSLELDSHEWEDTVSDTRKNKYFYDKEGFWKKIKTLDTHRVSIRRSVVLLCALAIAICIFLLDIFQEQPEQKRCLALLVFVAILWTTTIFPIYVTSLMIPVLVVYLRILPDEDPVSAATTMIASMFSSTILVAIGAFTMSMALMKYELSYRLASLTLSRVGNNPKVILLAVMLLDLFLSMWISNVASPTVCISLITPLLLSLPPEDRDYARVLLLGVAFSSNIGGIMSPISSPQNLIAISVVEEISYNVTDSGKVVTVTNTISWGEWLAVSIPYGLLATVVAWGLLWGIYRPKIQTVVAVPQRSLHKFNYRHVIVLVTCVFTIGMWSLQGVIASYSGSVGITALLPVVIFFGWGILTKEDLKELSWDVILLLSGGLALATAVDKSGLLTFITNELSKALLETSTVVLLLMLGSVMWLFANFTSHTVSALVMLKLIASVGCSVGHGNCEAGHYRLLVMGATFLDSGAMGLPVSSFPNAQTYSVADSDGVQYLNGVDFVKTGFLMGILEIILMVTVGYGLLILVGL